MTFEALMERAYRPDVFGRQRGLRVADVAAYLDQGGDVDRRTDAGETLLHLATSNGEADVIRLLVGRGADLNARGYGGRTPLHLAADGDCNTAGRDGRRATALPLTGLLIGLGADESVRDDVGETAREIAAAYGTAEVALYDALPRGHRC